MAGAPAVLDLEARSDAKDHRSLRLWLRLLSCTTRIEEQIRQRLRARFGTTLPRFDLLAQLEREPEGLLMGTLSRRLMVSGGNVTALVDQLEQEGLVCRKPQAGDRRAILVQLTPAGRRSFGAMAREHEAWVVELFAGLSERQHTQLHQLLGILKQGALESSSLSSPPSPSSSRSAPR